MPLGGGSCLAAQIEPTGPWCLSIACALSPRTRQTHVRWLALPHPSRLTIYTFQKENAFINTMIVVDLTSKGWVSSLQKMLDLAIKCSVWSLQIKDSWINSLVHRRAFQGYHFLLREMSLATQASQTNSSALVEEANFHFPFILSALWEEKHSVYSSGF